MDTIKHTQFLRNENGEIEYAVVSYVVFLNMMVTDKPEIPHGVIHIMLEQECSQTFKRDTHPKKLA